MAVGKSPLESWLENSVPSSFRNKYVLVLLLFFGWMLFFDKHNLFTQLKLQGMVDKLEQDQEYYSKQVKKAEQARYDLETNREKFARERYYMQARDEDVFIIKDEAEEPK